MGDDGPTCANHRFHTRFRPFGHILLSSSSFFLLISSYIRFTITTMFVMKIATILISSAHHADTMPHQLALVYAWEEKVRVVRFRCCSRFEDRPRHGAEAAAVLRQQMLCDAQSSLAVLATMPLLSSFHAFAATRVYSSSPAIFDH